MNRIFWRASRQAMAERGALRRWQQRADAGEKSLDAGPVTPQSASNTASCY